MRTAIITGANSGLGLECARAASIQNCKWNVDEETVVRAQKLERGRPTDNVLIDICIQAAVSAEIET